MAVTLLVVVCFVTRAAGFAASPNGRSSDICDANEPVPGGRERCEPGLACEYTPYQCPPCEEETEGQYVYLKRYECSEDGEWVEMYQDPLCVFDFELHCELHGQPEPPGKTGKLVVSGNNGKSLACVTNEKTKRIDMPDSPRYENTDGRYDIIATQCCDNTKSSKRDVCKRKTCSNQDECCLVGNSKTTTIKTKTFAQAKALCESLGFELCDRDCSRTGCFYDRHPVWTSLECDPDTF
eukprot:6182933-Pleurochrysis_carterae.AAC.2